MYIYICIYVVHAPAYASSHQTLLRKSMLLQSCSNYCTMTDAARTEESATSASAKPWLSAHVAISVSNTIVLQEKSLAVALHFSIFAWVPPQKAKTTFNDQAQSSVQLQKAMTT